MKYSFTSSKGTELEIRQTNNSIKLFCTLDGKQVRIDDKPLKSAIVTALLQEIIRFQTKAEDLLKEIDYLSNQTENVIDIPQLTPVRIEKYDSTGGADIWRMSDGSTQELTVEQVNEICSKLSQVL
jgi:hypothetical protein